MKTISQSLIGFSPWVKCLFAGIGLMGLALMLHPMSPENFIGVALRAPLDTVRVAAGWQAAALFWFSAALLMAAMVGAIRASKFQLRQRKSAGTRRLTGEAHAGTLEENWWFL